MSSTSNNHTIKNLEYFSKTVSAFSIFTGVVVLSGWGLDLQFITKWFPNWFIMKANTAMCFIFAGGAQWLLQQAMNQSFENAKVKWGVGFSIICGGIGLLTLVEYFLHVDIGIDQWVFPDNYKGLAGTFPGRMAPNTALAFLLLSSSQITLLMGKKTSVLIAQSAVLIVGLISLIALIGHMYGVIQLYKISGFIGMAVHTSFCFFILSLGFFAANPGHGLTRVVADDDETARIGFHLLLFVIAGPVTLGWIQLKGYQAGYYGPEFGLALFVVSNITILGAVVWKNLSQISTAAKKQKQAESELRCLNSILENKVQERTLELQMSLKSLQESKARFWAIAQSANDAIVSADADGNIILWNRGAELIFGYGETEALGNPLTMIMPERFRMAHQQGLSRLNSNASSQIFGKTIELTGVKKNTSEFPIELSLATWTAGDRHFYSCIIRDISERKKAEAQIADQQQTLSHLSKMTALGDMAAGIAHEINNPLCIIGLNSAYLKKIVENKKYENLSKPIKAIEETTDRIARIIKGLRLFSRDASQDPCAIVEVKNLIGETLSFCEARFKNRGVTLEVSDVPVYLRVWGKATELSQALLNILYNAHDAVDAIQEKRIQVLVKETETDVFIAVVDSGPGVPLEIQDKIMQPFFTTKEVGHGIGLGLGIAKGIIEGHEGRLSFESMSPNTTFNICLPKYKEVATQPYQHDGTL